MTNDPQIVAEIAALHEQYEAALVSNDVETLVTFFWDSPLALRFGVSESLYGAREIEEFRRKRSPVNLAREVSNLRIVTFGDDCAIVTLEFAKVADGGRRTGRQSQVWRKFKTGWKIVSAHVSLVPPHYIDIAGPLAGLPIPANHREGVKQSIDRITVIAGPLLETALDDTIEVAPVFTP